MTRGIRTVSDLRDRCYVDEATGCWHWRGAMSHGLPSMWIASEQRSLSLHGALSVLLIGKIIKGVVWATTCSNAACCNPEHRRRTTLSATRRGRIQSPAHVAKKAQARCRIPQEVIDAVRTSGGACVEVAAKYGIHPSYVGYLRKGKHRQPVSPFDALLRLAA